MLKWELAPHSKCGNYRILATEKEQGQIIVNVSPMGGKSFEVRLSELLSYDDNIVNYIKDMLPKILSGAYDAESLIRDVAY